MVELVKTLLEMSPEQIAEFCKAHPYHAAKVQMALRKLKAVNAEREAVFGRFNVKGIDLSQYR